MPNPAAPKESKFRCKICHNGRDNPIISAKVKETNLAKPDGVLYTNTVSFRRRMHEHIKSELHVELLADAEKAKLDT